MVNEDSHEQPDRCEEGAHPDARVVSKHSWWTLPNAISILRLLLVAPLCWDILTGSRPLTVVLLAVWASTDWVDGALARRLGQVSRTGEMLDPVSDRVGVAAIVLSMAVVDMVPWWMLGLIVAVDAMVTVRTRRSALSGDVQVSWVGKIRTAALMIGMVALVGASALLPNGHLMEPAAFAVFSIGVVLHVLAGWGYLRQAR